MFSAVIDCLVPGDRLPGSGIDHCYATAFAGNAADTDQLGDQRVLRGRLARVDDGVHILRVLCALRTRVCNCVRAPNR